jgi:hypothetical protein
MQPELLDRRTWTTRAALGSTILEGIEAFYNPGDAIPRSATAAQSSSRIFTPPHFRRHDHHTRRVRKTGSGSLSE